MNSNAKKESLADVANTIAEKVEDNQTIILANENTVVLSKVKTRNLGTVLDLVNAAFATLGIEKLGDLPKVDLENPRTLLQLIANMHGPVVQAAAEMSDLEIEQVNDLDIDDLILVVMGLIKLNKSFFLQRVLPILEEQTKDL